MKQIPLTRGQFSLVDDCDYDAVLAVGKWSVTKSGYAVNYWKDSNGKRHTLYLHRFIYTRILGHAIPKGLQIDHVDGATLGKAARLQNQRSSLRLANRSQNQAAKGSQINSTSGHKGITWRSGKFDVRIRYYHHRLHLGRYPDCDFDLAVAVYGYVHRILWGEFTTEVQGDVQLSSAIQDKLDKQIASVLQAVSRL